MAIKASDQVTIAVGVDVASVETYYKLQPSTSSAPAKPTTANPSGWSTSEPSYDGTSTDTLYTCQKTTLTDNSFVWGAVSKSSSYEAAKSAWNLANTANTAINDLEIGGRNLLLRTGDYGSWDPNSVTVNPYLVRTNDCIKFVPPVTSSWWSIEPHDAFISLDDWDVSSSYTISIDVKCDNQISSGAYPRIAVETVTDMRVGYGARVDEQGYGIRPNTVGEWVHFEYTFTGDYLNWYAHPGSGTPVAIKVVVWLYMNSEETDAVYFRNLKLEKETTLLTGLLPLKI